MAQDEHRPVQNGQNGSAHSAADVSPDYGHGRRDAKKPPMFQIKPPEGAPNVVLVLIDDIGFGATSTFGGPIPTPTFDRLATGGLRFNRFHTTALCSPTRASLLSGRNHHEVNVGSVMEVATGFPGNQGERPNDAKYFAETLRHNGYSTPHSENGMKRLRGKFPYPGRISAGQPIPASTSSTGLSAAKPTNGIPPFTTALRRSRRRTIPTITSPWT